MLNLIQPITPQYKGMTTQPKNGGGLLAQLLCYLFGGGTPVYQGSGQPVAKGCGVPGFPGSPVYKDPPVVDPSKPTETPALSAGASGSALPMTSGPITIVVG